MPGAWRRWIPDLGRADEMLDAMDLDGIEALFEDIPEDVRVDGLDLPDGVSEAEIRRTLADHVDKNDGFDERPSFLGGGVYYPEVPAAVDTIAERSELLTSYTPYQAEASQGLLQAIYEYQTLIGRLTGLGVANASLYDGATAVGEAAMMANRIHDGGTFLVPEALHPSRRAVLDSYLAGVEGRVEEVPVEEGRIDLDAIQARADDAFGCYVECPNHLGVWDVNVAEAKDRIGDVPLVVGTNPVALAVSTPPADYGADIVVGEGNLLGVRPAYGGPLLGVMACREEHVREMPGRLIGETVDAEDRRAYAMVLQTREQHIRRQKATSNICTNVGLNTIRAIAYAAVLGESGLNDVARELGAKARDLAGRLDGVDGIDAPAFEPHWNEFVAVGADWEQVDADLKRIGLHGPRRIDDDLLEDAALLAVSQKHTEEHLERLVDGIAKGASS